MSLNKKNMREKSMESIYEVITLLKKGEYKGKKEEETKIYLKGYIHALYDCGILSLIDLKKLQKEVCWLT